MIVYRLINSQQVREKKAILVEEKQIPISNTAKLRYQFYPMFIRIL